MTNAQLEKLQLEQMSVYADLLDAYTKASALIVDITEALTIADFTNQEAVQKLYNAIVQSNVGLNFMQTAFKAYAQSHSIELID